MDDLFRFFQLRPADAVAPEDIKRISTGIFGGNAAEARRAAGQFLKSGGALKSVFDLRLSALVGAVGELLASGPAKAADIRAKIEAATDAGVEKLIQGDDFTRDEAALEKTLVAAKLSSGRGSGDTRGLTSAAQVYDAIRRSVGADGAISRRPIVLDDLAREPAKPTEPAPPPPTRQPPAPNKEIEAKIAAVDEAISHFRGLSATSFEAAKRVLRGAPAAAADVREKAARKTAKDAASSVAVASERSWALSPDTIKQVPQSVSATLRSFGLTAAHPLPTLLQTLSAERTKLTQSLVIEKDAAAVFGIGKNFFMQGDDWVGAPASTMPTGHGNLKPVGIGDLLIVKDHVLRYEGGELAHVENVLKSEHLTRDTRRLERTETTVFEETETTKEEERDTQTTDRFSLKRETSSTLKDDTQFKAGVSVDAKYGPFVEVKANADFATHSSSEESAKQASEFSKDVVARSVSKVTERVLQRRSTTTVSEFEEKYSHGFDNTAGTGNISGVYQWVDKVSQAQVYNYGKRMLFDVMVPEPATMFFYAESNKKNEKAPLKKPVPFTLNASQITEGNYTTYAAQYDVTGLEAPPQQFKTISKAFDAVVPDGDHRSSKSQDLTIDEGYQAVYALFQRSYGHYDDSWWHVLIGSNWIDAQGSTGYVDMAQEVGSVSLAYDAKQISQLSATVEIFCERTDRAMVAWQLKTHAAIVQGYLAKQQAYETALAEQQAAAGVVIAGQNPLANARLIAAELRKQALTFLTAQQFTAFGALEVSAEGFPEPNLARSDQQMPYVRFFEQAFEWEHLVYFFYPYFWGWKPAWLTRMLLDDVDPLFADFLRAGAARLVFPVRPGFEAAVIHYLETGEIWDGGPPPDITSPLYVSIIKEIQEAQGAPGTEVPVGDPWLVRLPTTLAKLRPDDALPKWQKVGEDWQPVP